MILIRKYAKIVFPVLSISLLFAFFSCGEDSGLGASVDTKAPGISVTYPPSDAIIRDTFVFGGTCSDDKAVSSVLVTVLKINSDETTTKVYEGNAELTSLDSWKISLNAHDEDNPSYYNGYQFADGSYEVTAKAFDKAGHDSGTISRLFKIDNTAPLLIITKSKTVGSEIPDSSNSSSFGRTVQLEGQLSDSCSSGIAKLIVSFYNENGQGLLDAEFSDITDMSNSNPLVIARYYDKEERENLTGNELALWENYEKLYTKADIDSYDESAENARTKKIWYTVTASDEAKTYKDFSSKSSGTEGNSTKLYYRSTSDLQKLTASSLTDFPNFTILSLKQYLDCTDLQYKDDEALDSILAGAESESLTVAENPSLASSLLRNTKTSEGQVFLNFSLNPANNPSYTVSGKEILRGTSEENYEEGFVHYYAGSPVNVTMKIGLDKTNLKTSSITIYYAKLSEDEDGNEILEDKSLFWTWNKDVALSYLQSDVGEEALLANPASYFYTPASDDENTDSISVSRELSTENITAGNKYKFIVEGYDIDGREIIPSKTSGFGIYAKSSVPVPNIDFDDYDSQKPNRNMVNLVSFSSSVFYGSDSDKFSFGGSVKSQEELDDKSMSYKVILMDTVSNETSSYEKSIPLSRTKERNPEIEGDKWEYSWEFDFTGTSSDKIVDIVTNGSGLYTVAVTIYAKNGGGTAKRDFTYFLDTKAPELINLSLSAPANAENPVYKKDGLFYINNSKGKYTLSGTLTDNWKPVKTKYKIKYYASSESHESDFMGESSSASWTFPEIDFSGYEKTASGADATIEIVSYDEAGNEAEESVKIIYDCTAPSSRTEWTVSGLATKAQVKGVDFEKVDDSWYRDTSLSVTSAFWENGAGLSTIYYWIQKPNESSPDFTDLSNAKGSFSNFKTENDVSYFTNTLGSFVTSVIDNGSLKSNYLYLVAVDNAGNISSPPQTFTINIDTESPSTTTTSDRYTNMVSDISVDGNYSDDISGVASIKLEIDTDSTSSVVAEWTLGENATLLEGLSGSWASVIPASNSIIKNLSDGDHKVLAKVTDKAGNTNIRPIFTLKKDTEAPSVSIAAVTPALSDIAFSSSLINGKVNFKGRTEYSNAKPKSLQLYCSRSEPGQDTKLENLSPIDSEITESTAIYSWTVSDVDVKALSGLTEDSPAADLYIIPVVKDEAGNCNVYTETSEGRTYSFTKDVNYFKYRVDQNTDRPVIQFLALAKTDSDSWNSSKNLQVTISDDDGIESFEISEDGGTSYKSAVPDSSKTSWTYTVQSDDGQVSLKFKVTDKAGTTFETGDTSSIFKRPYFLYSGMSVNDSEVTGQNEGFTDYGLDSSSPLSIKFDTANPVIAELGIDVSDAENSIASSAEIKANPDDYKILSSVFAGGNQKYIKIFVPAYDSNLDSSQGSVKIKITNASTGDNETALFKLTDGSSCGESISLSQSTETCEISGTTYTYWESPLLDVSSVKATSENENLSGKKTVTVTVTDAAGNESSKNATFSLDNTGPAFITITSPSQTDSLTGTVKVVGSAFDNSADEAGISSIEFLVPRKGVYVSESDEDWSDALNNGTASAFKFVFMAGSVKGDLNQYEEKDSEGNYIYAVTENKDEKGKHDGTYRLPIYFKMTDKLGNTFIDKSFSIKHDPDGDRPVTALSYPTENDYDVKTDSSGKTVKSKYASLAGIIRVNGTVRIPVSTAGLDVGQVYIQIVSVADDESTITWSSEPENTKLSGEFASLGGIIQKSDLISEYGEKLSNVSDDWWGIAAETKSRTWNISLNTNGSLDPDEGSPATSIAIRASAINSAGKMGVWTDPVYVHVDSNAPTQRAEIRRYDSFDAFSPETNILSSKEFEADMYLKGTWYMVVTLEDNGDLLDVNVKKNGTEITEECSLTSVTYTYTDGSSSTDNKNADKSVKSALQKLYIPVESEKIHFKNVTYTVYVKDDSNYSSTGTYLFNIDNTAPEITALTGSGQNGGVKSFLDSNKNVLPKDSAPIVANSNYSYSLASTIKDEGSGFSKFFFYFLRDSADVTDSSSSRILDVINQNSSILIGSGDNEAGEIEITQGSGDSAITYKAYGKKYDGSLGEDRKSFTGSGISDDSHVRKGGLIKISGEYQIIQSKSGNTVTFEKEIPAIVDVSSAEFPYGQVINCNETVGTSIDDSNDYTYAITAGDDGDEMPETVIADGSSWNIDGVIYSDRMSDGPVRIVVLAFDEAGNVSGKTITTSIRNNAPRLAKLYLGTDLSGDGKYDDSEFNTYTFATADNGYINGENYVQAVDFATNKSNNTAANAYSDYDYSFKIRSGLVVVPEITGGNGEIRMAFLKDASEAKTYRKFSDATASYAVESLAEGQSSKVTAAFSVSKNKSTKKVTKNGEKDYPENTTPIFIIPGTDLEGLSDASDTAMSFTFWDSTEGTTIGSDSNYCFVRISDFTVDQGDTTVPKTLIKAFYWNEYKDNSVYGSKSASSYDKLEGHIELEADWIKESDSDTNYASGYTSAASGTGDGDPKVSGKITIQGYAFDNQRLSSIWISFDDFTPEGFINASGGNYTHSGADGDSATYYQAAYFSTDTGSWTSATATMSENSWEFSIDDSENSGAYLSQGGHKVFWTWSIDTSKIMGTAGTDKKARVIAFDHAGNVVEVADSKITGSPYAVGNKASDERNVESDNVPYYQMDIVPYITRVKTSLSSSNVNNPSVYARTALGHYPVYAYFEGGTDASETAAASVTYEKITIEGFNLKNSAAVNLSGGETSLPDSGEYSFTIPASAKSGEISVTVNGVESLNNKNNNGSKGSYTGTTSDAQGSYSVYANYYNRQPNKVNNNTLTDDVFLDIWDFNSKAALAYGDGLVDNLEMKINPANGLIGFAFSNGATRFNMPNTDNSYEQWNRSYDYMTHNALAYDANGYDYTVSVGGDINSSGSRDSMAFMSSRWGIVGDSQQSNKQTNKNHIRLDSIGQTGVKSGGTDTTNYCNKDRFQSQSIATHKNTGTSTSTDVYMAYYDIMNDEIRFKAGTVSSTGSTDNSPDFGNFKKQIDGGAALKYSENAKYCQIIADGTANTLGSAGQYVSIGATSGNVVVICWFDGTNLKYAYNTNPLKYVKDENNPQTSTVYAKDSGNTWTVRDKPLISNAGEYCQLVVANDNSIHIACYDSMNADLKYVYIPSYNGTPVVSTVDSYLDVGEHLTIDVAQITIGEKSYQIPYIGYRGSYPELPRYAYLADPAAFYATSNAIVNGAVSDNTYTGIWECSLVPSRSNVKDSRKMNVAVWKYNGTETDNGKLAYSTTGGSRGSSGGTNSYKSSYATESKGVCYGNGTNNGVMAYVVAPSSSQYCAETAQKR